MKALLLAAGLGTRLRPLTDTLPKALLEVSGKPLLYWALLSLRQAGICEVAVNLHHFAAELEAYLATEPLPDMRLWLSDERQRLLDTGGAVRAARPFLEGGPFLVRNVDILSNADLGLFARSLRPGALASLLVSERKSSRYLLFDEELRLCGWLNEASGELRTPYPGLDPSKCRKLAFSGFHTVSSEIFSIFEAGNWPEVFSIVDFYIENCGRFPIYGALQPGLKLLDVGKPEAFARAESFLTELQTI